MFILLILIGSCLGSPLAASNKDPPTSLSDQITHEDWRTMFEIAEAVRRVKRNPFLRDDAAARESTDSDLREKEDETSDDDDAETTTKTSSTKKSGLFDGSADDYCDKFEQHFSFYCVGEVDQSGKNEYVIEKFCPSYKKACGHKTITSSVSLTSWPTNPTNPFDKKITVTSRPVIESIPRKQSRKFLESSESDSDSQEDADIYYAELRKRYPCKPDCDRRIFPHCTQECKCDYIYPIVQRFCNPPPLPLFLNTCRLWYHGCPKYERYHYSSQFIYSKADKGKVLPGSPQRSQINPYNIPSPVPLRNRAVALAPIRSKRSADEDELELIIPPPVPKDFVKKDEAAREVALTAPQSRAILRDYQANLEEAKTKRKRKRSERPRGSRTHRRRRHRQHRNYLVEKPRSTTPRPPTPRELYAALKRINSITSGPGAVGVKSSPATLKGGGSQQEEGGLNGFLNYVSEQNEQSKQQNQQRPDAGEVAQQWSDVATNPKKFTEDLIGAASQKPNSEVDFNKVRPRTLSPGPSTKVEGEERKEGKARAYQGQIPILPSDSSIGARGGGEDTFRAFDGLSDSRGIVHTPRSRSPFTKPGLWEPNPDDPHSRDPANKYWYHPESVGVDWLNGQLQWGGHWAVPAAGAGGTAGMSAVHFPTIGSFLNIPDDYD